VPAATKQTGSLDDRDASNGSKTTVQDGTEGRRREEVSRLPSNELKQMIMGWRSISRQRVIFRDSLTSLPKAPAGGLDRARKLNDPENRRECKGTVGWTSEVDQGGNLGDER
jgi:hypothetical protein